MDSLERVHEIACLVRRLAEEVSAYATNVANVVPLGVFPRGWCQDSSRVLGKLLADGGEHGFKLVTGLRGAHLEKSHVWLERHGLIVDITADQFECEIKESVIVTDNSSWHEGWQQQIQDLGELGSSGIEWTLYDALSNHPEWRAWATATVGQPT